MTYFANSFNFETSTGNRRYELRIEEMGLDSSSDYIYVRVELEDIDSNERKVCHFTRQNNMVRPVDSDQAYTEEMFVFDEFNAAWFKDSLFDWLKSVIQHKSDPYLERCAKFAVHNTVAYLLQNQSK